MRKDRNPIGSRGYRNLFCRDYNFCLDLAVDRSWDAWSCNKCKYRFSECVEKRNIEVSREEIVEYGLTIQPATLDDVFHDSDFGGEYGDVSAGY